MRGVGGTVIARTGAAIAVVAAIGLVLSARDRRPSSLPRCPPPQTARQAALSQQGLPTTAAESIAQIDAQIAAARREEPRGRHDWGAPAQLGALFHARAQLSGDYRDFSAADAAFSRAFVRAPAGAGPHLARASFNLSVHRFAAVPDDLAAAERYRLPDTGDAATIAAIRGDLAFARGDTAAARRLYDRAAALGDRQGAGLRLANWWDRMGDRARAERLLDEVGCRIGGPQQQLHAYVATRRGVSAMARGDWPGAARLFATADAVFPGHWAIELQRASVLGLLGRHAEARALLVRIAARDRVPEALDSLAGLARARGDERRAVALAARATALWRERLALFPEAAYGHAVTHELNFGRPERALALARADHRLRPNPASATTLAAALIANGRPAEALATIRPAIASGWATADPRIVEAEALALLGRGAEADAARRAALAINPHSFDRNAGLTWLEH